MFSSIQFDSVGADGARLSQDLPDDVVVRDDVPLLVPDDPSAVALGDVRLAIAWDWIGFVIRFDGMMIGGERR